MGASLRIPRRGAVVGEDEPKWALHSGCTAALCLLLGGDSSESCISLMEGMRLREPLRTKEGLSVSSVRSGLSGEVLSRCVVLMVLRARWLRDTFHNYHVYGSSTSRDHPSINARTGRPCLRQGRRGVLLAVNRELTGGDAICQLPTPKELQECVAHARLTPPHSKPLNIVGVYNPSDDPE